ncbi:hypothetical protein [Stenotrophomonas maltophilia]|uniref:hypothetical protein n=1 Tax=Stenotrophomonas maltophilia TaxID=40324 RepID=UPI002B1D800E|nr:hypothetical protein [Stenotrophomonas maltophilia]
MADANNDVTIEGIHDAIERAVRNAFPDFRVVEFYRDDEGERMPTPACVMEMTECEPSPEINDGGSGKMACNLRFEARIIMQVRDKRVALELRKSAAAFATWLHQLGRFPGVSTDAIQVIAADPDDWMPANGGFRAWRIEWVVPALLGVDVWKNDGAVPQAFFSFAPDIGQDNRGEYQPIGGDA